MLRQKVGRRFDCYSDYIGIVTLHGSSLYALIAHLLTIGLLHYYFLYSNTNQLRKSWSVCGTSENIQGGLKIILSLIFCSLKIVTV